MQATVDASQLSEKSYKLAVAVGKNRHYHVMKSCRAISSKLPDRRGSRTGR